MRRRGARRAGNHELGPALGLPRAALPVRAATVGRDRFIRQRWLAAGPESVGHDRRQWKAYTPRKRAWRPAAHVGIESTAGVELGFCFGSPFLDGRRHVPGAISRRTTAGPHRRGRAHSRAEVSDERTDTSPGDAWTDR